MLRNSVEILTAFFVLVVLQTCLVPFLTTDATHSGGTRQFFRFDRASVALPDIVSNIFLYIPVGVLFYWSLYRLLRNGLSSVLMAVVFGAALSGAVEWAQAYIPARVSSITDLASNITGVGLGVCIAGTSRLLGPRLLGAVIAEFRHRPQATAIKAYCCALVCAAVLPFSFSLDPGLLKRSLKTIHFRPFESVQVLGHDAATTQSTQDYRGYAYAIWRVQRCWARWIAESASFAVLAWLLVGLLVDGFGFGRLAAVTLTAWFCGLMAVTLSVVQIPIVTRSVDVTDVLFRLFGAALGAACRPRHRIPATLASSAGRPDRTRHLAFLGSAGVGLYILVTGLMPFTFDAGPSGPRNALASGYLLPFFGSFQTRFDVMITDILEKIIVYALFAFLVVSCSRRLLGHTMGRRICYVTACGIGLATVIEIAQMFITVRITSSTDLILASAGCISGVVVHEQVMALYSHATAVGEPHFRPAPPEPAELPVPATTDALIGTLMDARPDAPVEPTPQKISPRNQSLE